MLALLAMISGAETCINMGLFGRSKEAARREPPALGSPSTFSGTSAWARTRDARSCPVARAGGAC
jgi:hypothetical protein